MEGREICGKREREGEKEGESERERKSEKSGVLCRGKIESKNVKAENSVCWSRSSRFVVRSLSRNRKWLRKKKT